MLKMYVGGQMFGETTEETGKIARKAMGFSKKFWEMGYGVYCPTTNCLLAQYANQVMLKTIIIFNLEVMEVCDCAFMLPGWQNSFEAEAERAHAMMLKLPVFYTIRQAERFWEKHGKENE